MLLCTKRTFDNGERVDREHNVTRDGDRCIGHKVAHVESNLLDCAVDIICSRRCKSRSRRVLDQAPRPQIVIER